MNPIYDTATRLPLRRRAIDSAELLVRSRAWRARFYAFLLGFGGALLMLWISKGVA